MSHLVSLLAGWRERHPNVALTIAEMTELAMSKALELRRLDVGTDHQLHALQLARASIPLYVERLVAALPHDHALAARKSVDWADLRDEDILIQEWDESQATRELYASLLGQSVRFSAHAASKQSVFALVASGFGRHAGDREPGRGYRAGAWYSARSPRRMLACRSRWSATRAGGCSRRPLCRLHARRDKFTAPCLTPARAAEASRRRGPLP